MTSKIILIGMFLTTAPLFAMADRIIVGHINSTFYNIYRPQTREEIYSSYRALVEKRDGVSKLEAQLIAQYEAVLKDLDHGYEIGKARVSQQTSSGWEIHIPSKFSLSQGKRPPDFIVGVDKQNGTISRFGPSE